MSYLNTKPLLYGIRHHPVFEQIELVEDHPANIARQLVNGQIDLGLIPVAATRRLSNWQVVSDYCIGCDGEVASVCLFSEVPIEEIKTVYLDYQSRTSVNLAKILLSDYWRQPVEYVDANGEDYRSQITGTTAGVVIGDRALQQRRQSKYIYDLGAAWKSFTGLPFVFAAWISTVDLPEDFKRQFNEANALGIKEIDVVIANSRNNIYDMNVYFHENISYSLTWEKKRAMDIFLMKITSMNL